MDRLRRAKERLGALWASCWPRRNVGRPPPANRVTKPIPRPPSSLHALRTSLARQLHDASRLHDLVVNAKAELVSANARIKAVAEQLDVPLVPGVDEKLTRLVNERRTASDGYDTDRQALFDAHRRLKSPLSTFQSGLEGNLLPRASRQAINSFLYAVNSSTSPDKTKAKRAQTPGDRRNEGRPPGRAGQQFAEKVFEDFYLTSVPRTVRAIDLLPSSAVAERPKTSRPRRGSDSMTVLERYACTQTALADYYPTKAPASQSSGTLQERDDLSQECVAAVQDTGQAYIKYVDLGSHEHYVAEGNKALAEGTVQNEGEFAARVLLERYASYEDAQAAETRYKELRDRTMRLGGSTLFEDTGPRLQGLDLDLGVFADHRGDGRNDGTAADCASIFDNGEMLTEILVEAVDDWRFDVPREASSDTACSVSDSLWDCESVEAGASIGYTGFERSAVRTAALRRWEAVCEGLRRDLEVQVEG